MKAKKTNKKLTATEEAKEAAKEFLNMKKQIGTEAFEKIKNILDTTSINKALLEVAEQQKKQAMTKDALDEVYTRLAIDAEFLAEQFELLIAISNSEGMDMPELGESSFVWQDKVKSMKSAAKKLFDAAYKEVAA